MVHTHDESLNLRADIKATSIALDSYIKMGGYRRAAGLARELSERLEALADIEMSNDRARSRVVEAPPPPQTREEFIGERLASHFSTGARKIKQTKPRRRRYEITELPKPELPSGE